MSDFTHPRIVKARARGKTYESRRWKRKVKRGAPGEHERMMLRAEARKKKVAKLRESGKTFREIGEEIGVSPERARQIYLKAIKKETQ